MSGITIEQLESNLNRVHDWVKSADEKVSILFGIQAGLLTILGPAAILWSENTSDVLSKWFLLGVLLLFFFSFLKCILALVPRLKNDGDSISYFGDIAKRNLSSYQEKVKNVTDQEYLSDITQQIHVSSIIATKKFASLKDALILFVAGIIFAILGSVIIIFF